MNQIYRFEGRMLEIVDESKTLARTKQFIAGIVTDFSKSHPLAHKTSRIKVVLLDSDFKINPEEEFASLKNTGIISAVYEPTQHSIRLFADHIETILANYLNHGVTWEEIANGIRATLAHELTHQLEDEIGESMRLASAAKKRLEEASHKMSESLTKVTIKDPVAYARQSLFYLGWMLQSEGAAKFFEEKAKATLTYSEAAFTALYNHAASEARVFDANFTAVLRQLEAEHKIDVPALASVCFTTVHYSIGLHMVYSSLFLDDSNARAQKDEMKFILGIFGLHPWDFIRRYEAIAEKKGIRPVFSLFSKKGILDYSLLLRKFAETVRKLK